MLMLDTRMEPAVARGMVQGAPDTLHSEFHLSYTMLLNLLLGEMADPESLLRASFRQFQMERSLPDLQRRVAALTVCQHFNVSIQVAGVISCCPGTHCLEAMLHA